MKQAFLRAHAVAALALALALALAAPEALAQDSHYWSLQYGPVGQLVGGQVIGGVPDLSATFYNPGALALRNESSYLLSTESFQIESVSTAGEPVRDGGTAFELFDTSSSRFGTAPSLLAGALPRWLGDETRLAWSFLTRQKLDLRLGQRLTDPFAGYARSAAESYTDQRVTESWGGLTLSHPLSNSFGLGLTTYGVYRGQRTRKELSAQAIGTDGRSLAVSGVTDAEYSHYRALAKLGLAWQGERWNAGFSLTTPSLGLFGGGKAAYTVSATGVDANGDGRPDPPVLQTATAEDLDSDYRSSWAIGAGASYLRGNTRFFSSLEWYAPVGRFTVIEVEGAPEAAGRLSQELGSVFNGGLGVEHVVNEDVSVYGAFHTDFSASVGGAQANVAVSDWDLYHLSGGFSFRIKDNRFTVGALWAFGSKRRSLDRPLPPALVPGAAIDAAVDIDYSRVTFLLGFEFGR